MIRAYLGRGVCWLFCSLLLMQTFNQIFFSMPMETVRKMLGKPMKAQPYRLKQQTHYDWRYTVPPNSPTIFTVVFD